MTCSVLGSVGLYLFSFVQSFKAWLPPAHIIFLYCRPCYSVSNTRLGVCLKWAIGSEVGGGVHSYLKFSQSGLPCTYNLFTKGFFTPVDLFCFYYGNEGFCLLIRHNPGKKFRVFIPIPSFYILIHERLYFLPHRSDVRLCDLIDQ